jgi:hypothetical protein
MVLILKGVPLQCHAAHRFGTPQARADLGAL